MVTPKLLIMMKSTSYHLGTSGLVLPVPNKLFYPEEFQDKSRLHYYASLMDTIEVNSSFYKLPQSVTMKRWAADVPKEFLFTFKAFREITHNKDLAFDPKLLAKFMQVIAHVGQKKGCLLVQLPRSIRIGNLSQLRVLLSALRANDPDRHWRIAFEFRHHSLYAEPVLELLQTYNMGLVIHDKYPEHSPVIDPWTDFVYLRFHGPEGDYKGSYSEEELGGYAEYIKGWLEERKKVFVYFNNTMGDAYANLHTLKRLLAAKA